VRATLAALISIIPLSLLILAGCASGPAEREDEELVPGWIVSPPEDTSEEIYFVGAGSNSAGDEEAARRSAAEGLVSSVLSFIGVEADEETSEGAREELEAYTTALTNTILGAGEPVLRGFYVQDTYVERRGSLVNVYILGVYEKERLLAQKARLQELLDEQSAAYEGYERRGDELLAAGEPYRAAAAYADAAAAAVREEVGSGETAYRRNLEKAAEALGRVSLERMNNNLVGYVRQSFSTSFRCRVVDEEGGGGLAGVPLIVRYSAEGEDGGRRTVTASVVSNDAGIAEFVRPAPRFVGSDTLTLTLDVSQIVGPLSALEDPPADIASYLQPLESTAAGARVSFSYTITSRAKEIPTAVWVIGFDNGGNVLPQSDIASGILEVLRGEDFEVSSVSLEAAVLERADSEVVSEFSRRRGSQYERLVFGSAFISDFSDEGQRYTVRVSGSVKAADVSTGDILFRSGTVSKSANGQNPQSAISAAFKEFGRHIGQALSTQLP
jgi:hypothetical protein